MAEIQLGGSITLNGFSELSGGDMIIIKKIVGNHVKRITELSRDFKEIKISLKTVHEVGDSKKFEFHVNLFADKQYNSEATEFNLYIGLDKVLKKVISALG